MKEKRGSVVRKTGRGAGLALLLVTGAFVLTLPGCEAAFTWSPFTALQRDPGSLSKEAKITWAEDALTSPDPEDAKAAYDLIDELIADATGEEKLELQQLAADLALKGSGITDSMLSLLSDVALTDTSADPDALTSALENAALLVDATYAAEYLQQIESLPASDVTYDQYFYAAVSVVLSDSALIESLATYDPAAPVAEITGDPEVLQAIAYVEDCRAALPTDGSVSSDIAAFLDTFDSYFTE